MDWLLSLLLPGALLILCWSSAEDSPRRFPLCTSCDEFIGKTCRKNLGSCQSKHPDFACQTKEVYTQRYTGEYIYKYSILGCPKDVWNIFASPTGRKNVFLCCNESYCNSLSVKDEVTFTPIQLKKLEFS